MVAPVRVPMAMKGDLPVPLGCAGVSGDAQDECMDVAYETELGAEHRRRDARRFDLDADAHGCR